jgi:hypothetical protein
MIKFISFPKITQFRQIIKNVVDKAKFDGVDENNKAIFNPTYIAPILTFEGTVKLHGTNAGVSINRNGEIWAQSREQIINIKQDNAGFAFFVENNKDLFREFFLNIDMKDADFITIFGEWAGGSIQKGVIAIRGLEKMFVIFAVKLSYNIDSNNDNDKRTNFYLKNKKFKNIKSIKNKIYNIQDFQKFSIDIDFENPALIQNKLIELTNNVENECPVGKTFLLDVLTENIIYENNGKIWFEKENKFINDNMKSQFKKDLKNLRLLNPTGTNYIKFKIIE